MKDFNYEVLAPVGNYEMLEAAIKSGANAIYLGGKLFNARAFADNFTLENIKEIVKLCHSNNIKVFVTVNTLLHDYELEEAINYIIDLYNIDIDAVIIQDLGLLSLIKKFVPDLPVHASTQINIYNYYGVKIMKELGFSRVVLARETPIEEIKYITENIDIELEVFIHGSLCVATSGQCLMSSYIGGRSGNRGKCAQPCRREYSVADFEKNTIGKFEEYKSFLSPKDLCTIDNVEELRDLGVKSFKIEGRMKKPEYVYTVVSTYSNKLANNHINEKNLEEVSNRGYTKGLLNNDFGRSFIEIDRIRNKKGLIVGKIISDKNKIGIKFSENVFSGDILLVETIKGKVIQLTVVDDYSKGQVLFSDYIYDGKVNSDIRRASSIKIKEELKEKSIGDRKKVIFKFNAFVDSEPELFVKYKDIDVSVKHEQRVYKAVNQPISEEKIKEQLSKLGNTNYILEHIDVNMDKDIFIPVKILNQLRRDGILELDSILNNFHKREYITNVEVDFEVLDKEVQNKTNLNIEVINGKDNLNNKYGDIYSNIFNEDYYFKMPRLVTTKDLEKLYTDIKNKDIKGYLINNIGDLQFLRDKGLNGEIIGDIGLNVLNSKTYIFLKSLNIDRITLSTELNSREINELIPLIDNDFEIVVHGYLTSMVMRNCPFSSIKKCIDDSNCENCRYSKDIYLKNENNEYFLVNRFEKYSELYHNKILNSITVVDEIDFNKSGNIRIVEYNEISNVAKDYFNKINRGINSKLNYDENKYTKGHFVKGID